VTDEFWGKYAEAVEAGDWAQKLLDWHSRLELDVRSLRETWAATRRALDTLGGPNDGETEYPQHRSRRR
jgi:hypothetical protein